MSYYLNHQIFIPVASQQVYRHFSNLSNLIGLHPYITTIEIKSTEKIGGIGSCDFIAQEELQIFRSLKIHVPITGQCRCNDALQKIEIMTIARALALKVCVNNMFIFKQVSQGAQVMEQVRIDGPPILLSYAGRKTKKIHWEMLQRLRTRMIRLQQQSQGIEAEEPENLLLKDKING